MDSKSFPVPNSTTSFWRSDPHPFDSHRSTENLPSAADVVVIGAGYAGASTAHHLLQHTDFAHGQRSMLILEAREACSGATGRNGGHLNADPYNRAATALESVGKVAADEATLFEVRHMKAVGDLIKRENIDCDFVMTRVTDVCLYEEGATRQKTKIEKLTAAGVAGLDDVFFSDHKTAERASGIKGAKGCVSHTACHLYPYRFVMHLLRSAVAQGVNLQTHTPVEAVSSEPDKEGRWTVQTPRGAVLASKVVFATNGYTTALLPELAQKIVPVRGICSRIVTPKPYPPYLPTSSVLHFSDHEYDYLIQRSDGSIIVGGARQGFYNDLGSWFDVYDDSELMESAEKYFDGYMQRNFHGWEDSEAYTDKVWTGIMGYTDDGFPYVGNVPGKQGQFVVAGFSGHGMPQVFLSAKAVASMIADDARLEDVDLPQLYHSTSERFASKQRHISLQAFDAVMQKIGPKN
ncbi:FAD dependent oxidoreductase [Neohortaea acidophila]|uniref:FAD dependent oxidoreductase n=1 Tax=Neohortaea acidophila TaxID=245834 RepID=A0A6A6PRA6_9PEZI|nr:FAD dependent oxidoreductase [Neohortaea acidophila]KAF2482336.1 FAD dependent oxidoreductase [Neohortaea acidophila]